MAQKMAFSDLWSGRLPIPARSSRLLPAHERAQKERKKSAKKKQLTCLVVLVPSLSWQNHHLSASHVVNDETFKTKLLSRACAKPEVAVRDLDRGRRRHLRKTQPLFECFPYVRPEPVLVN
jgi:hypothetical protein